MSLTKNGAGALQPAGGPVSGPVSMCPQPESAMPTQKPMRKPHESKKDGTQRENT
jgi:hypothetical protein